MKAYFVYIDLMLTHLNIGLSEAINMLPLTDCEKFY